MSIESTWVWLRDIFSKLYTNFVVAIIILLVGVVVARLVAKVLEKVLLQIELNKLLKKIIGTSFPIEEIIANFFSYLVYFVTIILPSGNVSSTSK